MSRTYNITASKIREREKTELVNFIKRMHDVDINKIDSMPYDNVLDIESDINRTAEIVHNIKHVLYMLYWYDSYSELENIDKFVDRIGKGSLSF